MKESSDCTEMFPMTFVSALEDTEAFTQASTRTFLESPQKGGNCLFENSSI
jgi:hypothetical protein